MLLNYMSPYKETQLQTKSKQQNGFLDYIIDQGICP